MKNNEKRGLLSWIKQYPTKAVIVILLIVIPIFVIGIISANFVKNGRKFYFEKENNEPVYIYQSDLASNKEISKYIDLNITYKSVTYTYKTNSKDEKILEKTEYKFNVDYTKNNDHKIVGVTAQGIMVAHWIGEQNESPKTINLNSSSGWTVEFNEQFPQSKFLIFKVKYPVLYLKINITISNPGSGGLPSVDENITLYYRYDISKSKNHNVHNVGL